MNVRKEGRVYLLTASAVMFFVFFFWLSRCAPVVGDDWGYAYAGQNGNAFVLTWRQYFSWSGRILSEFWGFSIAPHKALWNVLNAALLTGIYVLLVLLSGSRWSILSMAAAILLIFTVPNGVRMQTYTWIMGTTYVVPLLLFLVQLLLLKQWIWQNRMSRGRMAALILLNLCIPLYMENAAALMVGSDLLVLLYLFRHDRGKCRRMLVLTALSILGLCIIYFSPGAQSRMARDHAEFAALSLSEKISQNWSSFLNLSFMADAWLTRLFSLVMLVWVFRNRQGHAKVLTAVLMLVFLYGIVQSLAWTLAAHWDLGIFYVLGDITIPHSVQLNTLGYLGQAFAFLLAMAVYEKDRQAGWERIFLYLCALGADAVMCVSPIFDSRSSLYTLFLMMLVTISVLNELVHNNVWQLALAVCALCFAGSHLKDYVMIYRTVAAVTAQRASQIAYYQEHPEETEAWLIAYPDQTVHSGNIDPTDTYHLETFKAYYGLPQEMELHFYWEEDSE